MNRASRRRRTPICSEPLEPRMLLSASLVKDINATTGDSTPGGIVDLNGTALFFATDGAHSVELWASDGTANGTRLVSDFGATPPAPLVPASADGWANFVLHDVNGTPQLWRSDATTAGTMLVASLPGLNAASPFYGFARAAGKVFFATGTNLGLQLWVSDGTQAGTAPIASLACSYDTTIPHPYANPIPGGAVFNDTLYFVGLNSSNQPALYRTDGTAAGTADIAPMPGFIGTEPFASHVGSRVILVGANAVWSSDGTPSGTQQIATSGISRDDEAGASTNAVVYSSAGRLWATDGTVAGTRDITIANDAGSNSFVANGSDLYFQTSNGSSPTISWSMWKTDGTAAGSVKLGTFPLIGTIAAAGGSVYFGALDSLEESQLWKTDGTPAGTVLLRKMWDFPLGMPGQFAAVGNELFFSADDGTYGRELWKSDGTTAGTRLVDDINTIASASSNPLSLTDVNGELFFSADDGVHGKQLWKSDGTDAGTQLVNYVPPQPPPDYPGQNWLTSANGELFYDQGNYLWKSDGTDAGTQPVLPRFPARYSTVPGGLTNLNGALYFWTTGFTGNLQIWKTDGTADGTVLAANVPTSMGSAYDQLYSVNGQVLLDAQGQFYRIDNGSLSLVGPAPYPFNSSSLLAVAALGNNLYYLTSLPGEHKALYRTDGTAAGTVMVSDLGTLAQPSELGFTVAGSKIYFLIQEQMFVQSRLTTVQKLWTSDGTAAGTQVLRELDSSSITAGGMGDLTVLGNTLYFMSTDASNNETLWTSDGTPAGTVELIEIPATSMLFPAGGALFFNGVDSTHSYGVWETDGTIAGTQLVQSIAPPSLPYVGTQFTISGGNLFFVANDRVHGTELWNVDLRGSISGSVYNDANHNGVSDPGEQGMAGVTVFLDANHNGRLDPGEISTTTDASGNYVFSAVPGGVTYAVREVLPAGYRQTAPLTAATASAVAGRAEAGPVFGNVLVSAVPMDFNYLLTLAQHYAQPGTFATGDLTGDGQVNFDDLLLFAQNYGHPLGSAADPQAAAVALPATQTPLKHPRHARGIPTSRG